MPRSRRQVLATLGGAALGAAPLLSAISAAAAPAAPVTATRAPRAPRQAGGPAPAGGEDGIPVQGRALPGLESIDQVMRSFVDSHSLVGASLAVVSGGALKLARGYGHAEVQPDRPMLARTPMLLASVSKVMTAQTILKLVDQGRISLDERVFPHFAALRPPPGRRVDPRLDEITVAMCLWHTGGWNRKVTPLAGPQQVRRALRLNREPTPLDFIAYQKGVPLDFAPGTQQAYSNFGFVLLGALLAKIADRPYPEVVQATTLGPADVAGMRIDPSAPEYLPGEAHRYTPPMDHAVPGGHPLMTMAAGGWMASAVELVRLMSAIDGSRTGTAWLTPATTQAMLSPAPGIQRPDGAAWFGLGWDRVQAFPAGGAGGAGGPGGANASGPRCSYCKGGDLPGIWTHLAHLAIGVDYALLVNSSGEEGEKQLMGPLEEALRAVPSWPQGDLFQEFASGG